MNFLHSIGEALTPVLKTSQFLNKGVLTPEEFVLAGDNLVSKCGTWSWSGGDKSKRRSYLPDGKQYLVTRGVPCLERVASLVQNASRAVEKDVGDGWMVTMGDENEEEEEKNNNNNNDSSENPPPLKETEKACEPKDEEEDDDYLDLDDFVEDNVVTQNETNEEDDTDYFGADNSVQKTRTYDLHITYDKYYQTPRIWLFGYSENNEPLTPEQVFEDIMQDYAKKTVTIEAHPHVYGMSCASIHPCRHASMMKKIVDHINVDDDNNANKPRPDQYLFFFLKFIQSVVPTINYDFSLAVQT